MEIRFLNEEFFLLGKRVLLEYYEISIKIKLLGRDFNGTTDEIS